MKKIKYEITITMPDNNFVDATYLQALLQFDFNMADEGRWKVEVKELEESNESKS